MAPEREDPIERAAIAVPSRRRFLLSAGALLVAPSIVRASSLMPASVLPGALIMPGMVSGTYTSADGTVTITVSGGFCPALDRHPGTGRLGFDGVLLSDKPLGNFESIGDVIRFEIPAP